MRPPITNRPPKKALINPTYNGVVKSAAVNFVHSKSAAPAIMGVDSRKEMRAAAGRERPKNSAAVIVIPLRDTPGIIARAWATPINKTVLKGTV